MSLSKAPCLGARHRRSLAGDECRISSSPSGPLLGCLLDPRLGSYSWDSDSSSVYFMPVRSRIGIDYSDDGVRPGGDVGEAAPAEDVDAQDLAEGGDPV